MSVKKKPRPREVARDEEFEVYYGRVTDVGGCDGGCAPEAHKGDWVLGITVGDQWVTICPTLEKLLLEKLLTSWMTKQRPGVKIAANCGFSEPLEKHEEGVEILAPFMSEGDER